MACIFRRGNRFWISYYVGAKQIKKSLRTDNERVARSKLKRLEYELALGDLHVASKLPLPAVLEAFCKELRATRTHKSYKNDLAACGYSLARSVNFSDPGFQARPERR